MGSSHGQARAGRTRGCFICNVWNDGMITLADHDARICRPCATVVGRAILALSESVVAHLWPADPSAPEARQGASPANVDEIFVAFKAGVEKQTDIHDALTHLDLAFAYGEMGLMTDAIREAATALGERAPLQVASGAMNWLFARGRAHRDALRTVAANVRRE